MEAVAQNNRRWFKLLAACAVMIAIGFIYGWSVFSTPIAAEFAWEPTTVSFTFTVLMWAFCAGGIIGPRIANRTSLRTTLIVTAAGICAAFVLTALLVQRDTPWVMYVTYGAVGGCCVGMAYTTTMGATIPWFPDRTGLASGLMLLCYGMSTMVLGSVAAALFSSIGWRQSFVVLSAGIAAAIILLSFAIRKPSSEEIRSLGLLSEKAERTPRNPMDPNPAHDLNCTTADMVKRPVFYLYVSWMVSVSCIGLGLIGSANQLALDIGTAVPVAAIVVGILSLCNGFGRLATGFVFDLVGVSATMAIVALAHAVGCLLVLIALSQSSLALMVVGMIVGGLGIGGTSVVGSGFTAKAFGTTHFAENLSVLNLSLIPAALIGPLIMSSSATGAHSYSFGVMGLFALGIIAAVLSWIMRTRWEK